MSWPAPPLGSLVETIVPARDKPADLSGDIPWLRIEDFEGKYIDASKSGQGVSAETVQAMNLRLFEPGTVVCTCSCDMGTTAIVRRPLITNQTFIGLRPRNGQLVSDYLFYALMAARAELNAKATGAIQSYLSRDDFRQLRLPMPPVATQRAIADFLDRETARIDALIIAKQRMTELLEERWQSVMHNAVAGRSFAAGPRTPWPVAWLADAPESWPSVKVRFVARLGSGHTPSRLHPEWWTNTTIPWITTGEVAQMRDDRIEFIEETREMISEMGLANSAAELHPTGTVVLCRTAASAGYSAIMPRPMATSQDFATWTCGPRLRPRFLLLCLRVMRQDLLGRLAMGSTHKTIYMPDIESIEIPLPPVADQDVAVDHAYRQLELIDRAMGAVDRDIDLIAERRKVLITAAVTGALDIPGVAVV